MLILVALWSAGSLGEQAVMVAAECPSPTICSKPFKRSSKLPKPNNKTILTNSQHSYCKSEYAAEDKFAYRYRLSRPDGWTSSSDLHTTTADQQAVQSNNQEDLQHLCWQSKGQISDAHNAAEAHQLDHQLDNAGSLSHAASIQSATNLPTQYQQTAQKETQQQAFNNGSRVQMVITAVNNRDAVESTSTMLQRPMQGTRSENLRHVQGQSDLQTVHTYAALQSTHDTTRKMICPTCGKAQAPIVSQANDNVAMHINNSHQTQYTTHVKPQCECNWSPSTLHCSLQNHLKAGLKFIGTAVTIVQGINGFGIHSDIRVLLYMEVVSTVMMELHVSELSAFAAKLAVCFEKSLVHCQYALTYVRDNTTTY